MLALYNSENVYIETERCILRPYTIKDVADVYEYAKDKDVGIMAGWKPHSSIEMSECVVKMFIAEKNTLAIEDKSSKKVIGSISLMPFNDNKLSKTELRGRELGYALSKEYWGKGIMTECARSLVNYAFNSLNFDFVICGCFKTNVRSKHVIKKLDFKYYKQVKYHTQNKTIENCTYYIKYSI